MNLHILRDIVEKNNSLFHTGNDEETTINTTIMTVQFDLSVSSLSKLGSESFSIETSVEFGRIQNKV